VKAIKKLSDPEKLKTLISYDWILKQCVEVI
jgi:hypothetical protein